jgi:hypothetical protein
MDGKLCIYEFTAEKWKKCLGSSAIAVHGVEHNFLLHNLFVSLRSVAIASPRASSMSFAQISRIIVVDVVGLGKQGTKDAQLTVDIHNFEAVRGRRGLRGNCILGGKKTFFFAGRIFAYLLKTDYAHKSCPQKISKTDPQNP